MAQSVGTQKMKQQRTCVVCRKQADKAALYRLVRDDQNKVHFDSTGKRAGRGAYVCSLDCMERAYKTKQIERALRTSISAEEYSRIADELIAAIPNA